MKSSSILGLNARSQEYFYKYNSKKGKKIADSKLQMFKVLKRADVPTPLVVKKFRTISDIYKFDWESLPSSFALKPSRGFGGEGIVVVKKKIVDKEKGTFWITTQRDKVSPDDLKMKTVDILEGAYSIGNVPDVAFIQEYVGRHKAFRKYAYRGTPDVRVIVFNKIPVMAMLRLPTKESGGRANLHQGAIGVGIDITTGITTKSIHHGSPIKYKPGTKKKLNGIKIPNWSKVLELASRCSEISSLGYLGVDIILHPKDGPMVLELNARPGLQIQLANMAGLKKRLEKVDDLEVRDSEHGVKIAKAIFAEGFASKVRQDESIKTIHAIEEIKIISKGGKKVKIMAKIDTGAWRTSIKKELAQELGLLDENNILWTKKVTSSLGTDVRPVINLAFYLAGNKVITPASVASRMSLKYPVIIGRKNIRGMLVDPHISIDLKKK